MVLSILLFYALKLWLSKASMCNGLVCGLAKCLVLDVLYEAVLDLFHSDIIIAAPIFALSKLIILVALYTCIQNSSPGISSYLSIIRSIFNLLFSGLGSVFCSALHLFCYVVVPVFFALSVISSFI